MTLADARSKGGSASTVGIQFDKAELKDGTEIALNVVIQAMAPRQSGPMGGETTVPARNISGRIKRHRWGAVTRLPNSPQTADAGSRPGNFPAAAGPRLDERSQERGRDEEEITLDSLPVDGRAATIVSSNGKSVKLEDGTRLLLVVQEKKGEAATQ